MIPLLSLLPSGANSKTKEKCHERCTDMLPA